MDLRALALKNVIFLTKAGSHSYGMNTKTSDLDTRGIFLPPRATRNSPFFKIEQVETKDSEKDEVIYNVIKFISLYVDMNPNILELLWVDESDILVRTDAYDLLRDHREALLSKKVQYTFTGYAFSQIQRMKGHQRWINNPQQERKPMRTDYLKVIYDVGLDCVTENHVLPEHYHHNHRLYKLYDKTYGLVKERGASLARDDGTLDIVAVYNTPSSRVEYLVAFDEQQYEAAYNDWKNYWDWKRNRNEARSDLELKYGYDTKHASHCVRLLRMGVEILEGKGVIVKRPDAKELLSIRSGAWSYDKVLAYADEMEKKIETVATASTLPHSSDKVLANGLLQEVLDAYEVS